MGASDTASDNVTDMTFVVSDLLVSKSKFIKNTYDKHTCLHRVNLKHHEKIK